MPVVCPPPSIPHTSLWLGGVKAVMVISSEMIFCSHSAKEIGMDVIHLGCSPCRNCLLSLQPPSTRLCTHRGSFSLGRGSVLLSLLSDQRSSALQSALASGWIWGVVLWHVRGDVVAALLLASLPLSTIHISLT